MLSVPAFVVLNRKSEIPCLYKQGQESKPEFHDDGDGSALYQFRQFIRLLSRRVLFNKYNLRPCKSANRNRNFYTEEKQTCNAYKYNK